MSPARCVAQISARSRRCPRGLRSIGSPPRGEPPPRETRAATEEATLGHLPLRGIPRLPTPCREFEKLLRVRSLPPRHVPAKMHLLRGPTGGVHRMTTNTHDARLRPDKTPAPFHDALQRQPVVDMHTPLYPPSFGTTL